MNIVSPPTGRETFTTSRLLDFFSEKELAAQIGHDVEDWPLVALKELIDNALDACEEAGIAPQIEVELGEDHITITDNGPGLPPGTFSSILDFSTRTSSREAYVEPTRGRQGNALKTLLAMPFVLDGERGRVVVEARDTRHAIEIGLDRIQQEPTIDHGLEAIEATKGTKITLEWPEKASFHLDHATERFLQVAGDYAWLNPHLDLTIRGRQQEDDGKWRAVDHHHKPTNTEWAKWTPTTPPVAHWYACEDLGRLIAATIAKDKQEGRDRTVREFVGTFKGLSSTAKQKRVTDGVGLGRAKLSQLAIDGGLDEDTITSLLNAMKAESKPVKRNALGVMGEDHFRQRCEIAGCAMDTFKYSKVMSPADEPIPTIIEVAFAAHGGALEATADSSGCRRLITGVNWSPALVNPFRELTELGDSLDSLFREQFLGAQEPIVLVVHTACPRVRYADRGKSSVFVEKEAE